MSATPGDGVFFTGPAEFEAWLEEHADTADELWIRFAKKATGIASLDWAGAVEVALCFGWIDGQVRRVDDSWHLQRFTPRRPKSAWAKLNRVKVEKLIAEGRMRPRGLAEVERAKADGRWDAAYDPPSTATVPDDLAAALKAAGARKKFDALDSSNRFAVLHRVQRTKTPAGRAKAIERVVNLIASGGKPHP
ncbi:YdeI/OmpD-associated family protein [Sporichthya polymorpha]|uniref:YdeI/OmpD-associated family protein n=1 Tax=Sporichthya polymorpha TaxID=35751 RepID=UPI000361AAD8|nr:YdeI/OmpD-associated family protein [Sporichthya polymorpha]